MVHANKVWVMNSARQTFVTKPTGSKTGPIAVIVSIVPGMVLIFAGIMKLLSVNSPLGSLHADSPLATQLVANPPFAFAEIIFGAMLVTIPSSRPIRTIGLVAFFAFAMLNVQKILLGDANCGCFGSLSTSPTTVLVIDLVCLACLLFPSSSKSRFRAPDMRDLQPGGLRKFVPRVCAGIGWVGLMFAIAVFSTPKWEQRGPGWYESGSLSIINWHETVGQHVDAYGAVLPAELLRQGKCVLYALNPDCPRCEEVIEGLNAMNSSESCENRLQAIVWIRTPSDSKRRQVKLSTQFDLPSVQTWNSQAPLEIQLSDGYIQTVNVPETNTENFLVLSEVQL